MKKSQLLQREVEGGLLKVNAENDLTNTGKNTESDDREKNEDFSSKVNIRSFSTEDKSDVMELMAKFRVVLASFRNKETKEDIEEAKDELDSFLEKNYPIYVADLDGKIIGYLVCRIEDKTVWAEALYVLPEFRRKGIGSSLYQKAEKLAEEMGNETVYNWIHPNNEKIINFLEQRGYDVLNLVEIRKEREGENLTQTIKVDDHDFKYSQ